MLTRGSLLIAYRFLIAALPLFPPGRPMRDSEHCAGRLEPIGERTDA
jgi:hypothetical protein